MTRVSASWLALRERADAAARATGLIEHLPAGSGWVIHDLGCGTGAMGRWLAPLLGAPQHWVLHDDDPDLLEAASLPERVGLETRRCDVTTLSALDLRGADLITASALLDLLTADELFRLLTACARAGCPVLLTLSVTGRVDLTPADPLDREVAAAFNAHQRRGALLGPDAVTAAAAQLGALGMDVHIRPSPWRLGPAEAALTGEWFRGWWRAACEQRPGLESNGYAARRLEQARSGRLAVTVHHADLLALPRPAQSLQNRFESA